MRQRQKKINYPFLPFGTDIYYINTDIYFFFFFKNSRHRLLLNLFQMFHPKLFWRALILFTEHLKESNFVRESRIEYNFINRLFSGQQ